MLPMLFVLAVAPSLTLLDSIKAPNCQAVELLPDERRRLLVHQRAAEHTDQHGIVGFLHMQASGVRL